MKMLARLVLLVMAGMVATPADAIEPLLSIQTNPKVIARLARVKEKHFWREWYAPKPELKCYSASIEKYELDHIIDIYCFGIDTEEVFLYDDLENTFTLLRR